MSSVAFRSPDRTVHIGGGERIWASSICTRLMEGMLDIQSFPDPKKPPLDRLLRMLRPDHWVHAARDGRQIAESTLIALGGFSPDLQWNGHEVSGFIFGLNTALTIGSDPIRLMARIHGSCEIHGWVDGQNRAWLADIIDEGRASGIMRVPYQTQYDGWDTLAEMLRARSDAPVVMSYSVTNEFPNFRLTVDHDFEETPWSAMTEAEQAVMEEREASFDELSGDERWSRAFAALKARDLGLELRPDGWRSFRFGHSLSALDILAEDWEARLNEAFPTKEADSPDE